MDVTGHRRRSANSGAFTVAELTARLRPDPEPQASAAGQVGTTLSVGQLLQREGQAATAAARRQQAHSRHAAERSPVEAHSRQSVEPAPVQARPRQSRSRHLTEPSQWTSRSLVLAAIAGAAVVYGSVLAGGLSGGHSDEHESNERFNPDGARAGQHKAAIPTADAQVIRPIPAAKPQPSPMTTGPFTVTRDRVIIESVLPSSDGPALSRPGTPGTRTPPPSRDASEGNRPPPSSTAPSPTSTTAPPPSEDPVDSGGNEQPDPGRDNGTGGSSGDSGSSDSGSSDSGSSDSGSSDSGSGDSGSSDSGSGESGSGDQR